MPGFFVLAECWLVSEARLILGDFFQVLNVLVKLSKFTTNFKIDQLSKAIKINEFLRQDPLI